MVHAHAAATLLTGGSGYVGRLLAAKLLAERSGAIVLPVRSGHSPDEIRDLVLAEVAAAGISPTDILRNRIIVLPLPPTPHLASLDDTLRELRVDEIVHCAGSADYFDLAKLRAGNIDLTRAFVDLGKRLNVRRFIFISTAFSSGYQDGLIRETLHSSVGRDPTPYTATKREAEWIVADSGLPYLILRPSVVIGDSRDGRYHGPNFGLYQLYQASERFLCASYLRELHVVAPRKTLPLVHQDALQMGFVAAYRHLEPGSVVHLVSRQDTLPTVRDVYDISAELWIRPHDMYCYDDVAQIPMERLTSQERYFIEFTRVNVQISTHRWHFERSILDRFCAKGLLYADVTPETVAVCMQQYLETSPRAQRFMRTYATERSASPFRRHEIATTPPVSEGPLMLPVGLVCD